MPSRPPSPCPACGRISGCACARTSSRNHGGVSAALRGYGRAHRAERAAWAEDVEEGTVICRRCHVRILPREAWDLGHSEDRQSTAPEHARCNRAAPRQVQSESGKRQLLVDRDAELLVRVQVRPICETSDD